MKQELLGHIGVDTSQVVIMDPEYLRGYDSGYFDDFFGKCCDITSSSKRGDAIPYDLGGEGKAVVAETGYGDGTYPVYAEYDEDGRIRRIIIDIVKKDIPVYWTE